MILHVSWLTGPVGMEGMATYLSRRGEKSIPGCGMHNPLAAESMGGISSVRHDPVAPFR